MGETKTPSQIIEDYLLDPMMYAGPERSLEALAAIRAQLTELDRKHESACRLLDDREREVDTLRAQLTEKDREIERLTHDPDLLETGMDLVGLQDQLSASQAREEGLRQAITDLTAQELASQAREREAVERAEKAEHRIAIMREGILEARSEGCACDFHLYAMDRDLDTPEALDAYLTLEAKNTKLACENLNLESALAAARKALEEAARWCPDCGGSGERIQRGPFAIAGLCRCCSGVRAALNGDSHAE